jgi:SAM-dependent methyltransferase
VKPLVIGRRVYDLMYRWWAPWDAVGVRPELRRLVEDGTLTPSSHPRAIDLGCGTGANAVFLAELGFDVTAVDFSPAALAKAAERARRSSALTGQGPGGSEAAARLRLVEADLTGLDLPALVGGPFDLLVDASTLDDLAPAGRTALAGHIARLARPGAVLLCWCFYAARDTLPRVSFTGPSRMTPGIEPGEEQTLFGAAFDIEMLRPPVRHEACLLLRRRADGAAQPRT